MTLLAFLVAVAYVPGIPSATLAGRWGVLVVGAAVLISRASIRMTAAHWWGLALLLWCALGLLWSSSRWDTLGGLLHLAAFAGVFCVAAESEDDSAAASALVSFGIGLSLSAAFAVAQQLGWQPVLNISDHPVGLFLSKNAAVEAAVPVLVWVVVSVFSTKMRDWSPDRVTGTLLVLIPSALVMSVLPWAKETWLMLVAALLVIALHWARRQRESTRAVTGVLLATLGLATLTLAVVASQSDAVTGTLNERLAVWQTTLAAWWLQPWGWGLGTYQVLLSGIESAHDDYFQLLFETGPVGLVLAVALFATVLRSGDLPGKAALASILASALVWWPLQQPASGFLAALLAGSCVGAGRSTRVARPLRRDAGRAGVRHYGVPRREATVRAAGEGW